MTKYALAQGGGATAQGWGLRTNGAKSRRRAPGARTRNRNRRKSR